MMHLNKFLTSKKTPLSCRKKVITMKWDVLNCCVLR